MKDQRMIRVAKFRLGPNGKVQTARCDLDSVVPGDKVAVRMFAGTNSEFYTDGEVISISSEPRATLRQELFEKREFLHRVDGFADEARFGFDLGDTNDEVNRKRRVLTKEAVIERLKNMGFRPYYPLTSSYQLALIASNKTQSLYFLVGRLGIDFRLYDTIIQTVVDDRRRLQSKGGKYVRNYYKNSQANVHDLTLEIATRFLDNQPLSDDMLVNNGTSLKSLRESSARHYRKVNNNDMVDIYESLSTGDGEDVYMGDGVWLDSSGSMDDRGR